MTGYRVGIGVDAHAFGDGVALVLGGVPIDHPRGLVGHSDGDVIQDGGNHVSPVDPLLHACGASHVVLGCARAKPGFARGSAAYRDGDDG